jgi:hypothetical protein
MTFFLAESLVFGVVGAVGGYLIGQVLSVGASHFFELDLNYSSLSMMFVIFLIVVTVLLSTIYPASVAAKAAVPSGQRRWSLPVPSDEHIHLQFPFRYEPNRVCGVCAYLHDFMEANSEASTGKFLARLRPPIIPSGEPHGAAASAEANSAPGDVVLSYEITPIPFDLAVSQNMEIRARFDDKIGGFVLSTCLTRTSGERGNWLAVNQPFLEAIRKHLLRWPSQSGEWQDRFGQRGRQMLGSLARRAEKFGGPRHIASKETAS